MDTDIPMPAPEFKLGAHVILKDSGKREETLLAGVVVEIVYSLARSVAQTARIAYSVELELGLRMRCEAQDLYLDRRPKP